MKDLVALLEMWDLAFLEVDKYWGLKVCMGQPLLLQF